MFYGIYAQIMAKKTFWLDTLWEEILEIFVRNGIDVKFQR